LIVDRAYEGNLTRWLARATALEPVLPPLRTRGEPWQYDTELY